MVHEGGDSMKDFLAWFMKEDHSAFCLFIAFQCLAALLLLSIGCILLMKGLTP